MSQNIPSEQWAQVVEKSGGPVKYKKIPVQKPGPDEVLVNVKYSGELSHDSREDLNFLTIRQVSATLTCTP